MSETTDPSDAAAPERPRPRGLGERSIIRRVVTRPAGVIGIALTLFVSVVALMAKHIATRNPFLLGNAALRSPSRAHPFGTDNLGRDLFNAVIYGMRTSMTVVVWVTVLSLVIGVSIGAVAGLRGGRVERILMRFTELFQIVPRFFLALLVLELYGRTERNLILLLGLTSWTLLARVVRAETLSVRTREYVGAARAYGASDRRILVRHVLPNIMPSVAVVASLNASRVILLEAALAFLGLSDQTKMSLGFLINNAQQFLQEAWWMSVFPGLAIMIAAIGINLLADTLNDEFNPLRRRRPTPGGAIPPIN